MHGERFVNLPVTKRLDITNDCEMLIEMSAAVDFNDNLAFLCYYSLHGSTFSSGRIRAIHWQLGWQLVRCLLLLLLISTNRSRRNTALLPRSCSQRGYFKARSGRHLVWVLRWHLLILSLVMISGAWRRLWLVHDYLRLMWLRLRLLARVVLLLP